MHSLPIKPRELVNLFKKNGFEFVHCRGSHWKMHRKKDNNTVIIPVNGRQELNKILAIKILKQGGIYDKTN